MVGSLERLANSKHRQIYQPIAMNPSASRCSSLLIIQIVPISEEYSSALQIIPSPRPQSKATSLCFPNPLFVTCILISSIQNCLLESLHVTSIMKSIG